MSRAWKPGDAAMIVMRDGRVVPALRHAVGWSSAVDGVLWDYNHEVLSARPAVVLDPEDHDQMARLADAFCAARWSHEPDSDECDPLTRSSMTEAVRSLLAPPRPPEPLGIGALAEDDNGFMWIRAASHSAGCNDWHRMGGLGDVDQKRTKWSEFTAVRVLSEGVAE